MRMFIPSAKRYTLILASVTAVLVITRVAPGVEPAGQDRALVNAQLVDAEERLKKDNPEMGGVIPKALILKDGISWDLRDRPKLKNISGLQELPLTSLNLYGSSVADLTPLKDMPLRSLGLARTPVTDLAPLQGMPLQSLGLPGTAIRSLAPLAGAPLEELMGGGRVDDLSPLAGMPLRVLAVAYTGRDISALRDMPLTFLSLIGASEVRDFSVLASLKSLKHLTLTMSPISDLSVLEGLPIERLELQASHNLRDFGPMKKLPKLKWLNLSQVPARSNIDALAGLELEILYLDRTRIADLAPLKGMKLKKFGVVSDRPILDYSVLAGMPLEELTIGWMPGGYNSSGCLLPDTLGFMKDAKTLKLLQFGPDRANLETYDAILSLGAALRAANPNYKAGAFYGLKDGQITEIWASDCVITNLSPLKGLKLTRFIASRVPVMDLAPLAGMPLVVVHLTETPVRDLSPLKGMPLKTLAIRDSQVSDLAPLKDLPIEELDLTGAKVTDYGQLRGMKLRKIWVDENISSASLGILREIGTLTQINGLEATAFWRNMLLPADDKAQTDAVDKPVQVAPPKPPKGTTSSAIELNTNNTVVVHEKEPGSLSGFTERITGKPERQKTTASVRWDAEGIEVVFDCADSSIAAVFPEHDAVKMWKDDCVSLWLDPMHTHNPEGRCVMVQLSASGATHDMRDRDRQFDVKGLKATSDRTATGWQGTIRAPWRGLGLERPKAGDVWGFNLTRNDQVSPYDLARSEYTSWAATDIDERLDRWGHLVFVQKAAKPDDKVIADARKAIDAAHLKRRHDAAGTSP